MALPLTDMDERLANMIYSQQLREKQEFNELLQAQSVSNAQAEFRRGLKELVRNHLNACMTLASCSNSNGSADATSCGNYDVHRCRLNHVKEACNICQFRDLMLEDGEEEEEGEQLVHRRRQHHSTSDGDSAETSAARRRQSRILNRWAARQAQEMITTMERQAREAELLSLAGLHTVSTRDCSFLRESSPSRSVRTVERPSTRASTLVQMWRDLEGESRGNSPRESNRVRMSSSEAEEPRSERTDNQTLHCVRNVGGRESNSINDNVNEGREHSERNNYPAGSTDSDVNSQTNNEVPQEQARSEMYSDWEDGQLDRQNVQSELQLIREQSGEDGGERERVRQIVRRWVTESRMTDRTPNIMHNLNNRAIWCSEIEQEQVRDLSQEQVHVRNEQRDASGNTREHSQRHGIQPGLVYMQARQREAVQGQTLAQRVENQQDNVNRNALRLRGRQAFVDLLMRIVRERQRELERLMEYRAVSDFSHRNRIQSLLRGRFLRHRAVDEEHGFSSAAAGELGQLRQRRTVSDLREGFRNRLNSTTGNQDVDISSISGDQWLNDSEIQGSNISRETGSTQEESHSGIQGSNQAAHVQGQGREVEVTHEDRFENDLSVESMEWQEVVSQSIQGDWQGEASEVDSSNIQEFDIEGRQPDRQENAIGEGHEDWEEDATQGVETVWEDMNWQESGPPSHIDGDWGRDVLQDANGDWQEGPSQDVSVDWEDHPQEASRPWHEIRTTQRVSDLQSLEEATEYSMELRELLSRRSVSTALASEFRERMDQLILSYLQNQGRPPAAWDLQEPEQEEQQDVGQDDSPLEIRDEPRFISPPPPPPLPPHQLWRHEMRRRSRSRSSFHNPEIEWEAINELRSEIGRLQQGMNDLQRMVETCMDMQLELQRSVRQEVSAALNRSSGGEGIPEDAIDGSKWVTVRKGICCICCDRQIDSLLYRCGHMCTCSKCANELVRNGGKCPMCRAPIVEVVRAYCEV